MRLIHVPAALGLLTAATVGAQTPAATIDRAARAFKQAGTVRATFEQTLNNPLTGNHGGPQTRDNFFAVTGGGDGVRSQSLAGNRDAFFDDTLSNPAQAENVDVAPTVMGLFGLAAPRDSAGLP